MIGSTGTFRRDFVGTSRSTTLPILCRRGMFESERGRALAGPTPSLCDPESAENGSGSLASLKGDLRTHCR